MEVLANKLLLLYNNTVIEDRQRQIDNGDTGREGLITFLRSRGKISDADQVFAPHAGSLERPDGTCVTVDVLARRVAPGNVTFFVCPRGEYSPQNVRAINDPQRLTLERPLPGPERVARPPEQNIRLLHHDTATRARDVVPPPPPTLKEEKRQPLTPQGAAWIYEQEFASFTPFTVDMERVHMAEAFPYADFLEWEGRAEREPKGGPRLIRWMNGTTGEMQLFLATATLADVRLHNRKGEKVGTIHSLDVRKARIRGKEEPFFFSVESPRGKELMASIERRREKSEPSDGKRAVRKRPANAPKAGAVTALTAVKRAQYMEKQKVGDEAPWILEDGTLTRVRVTEMRAQDIVFEDLETGEEIACERERFWVSRLQDGQEACQRLNADEYTAVLARGEIVDGKATLYTKGNWAFRRIEEKILDCKKGDRIDIEMCSWADDSTGKQLAKCMCDAKDRGVNVHIEVDHFGSLLFGSKKQLARRALSKLPALLSAPLRCGFTAPEIITLVQGLATNPLLLHTLPPEKQKALDDDLRSLFDRDFLLQSNKTLQLLSRELGGNFRIENKGILAMNHRKIFTFERQVAGSAERSTISGGMNIGDEYSGGYSRSGGWSNEHHKPWHDHMVEIEGTKAADASRAIMNDEATAWNAPIADGEVALRDRTAPPEATMRILRNRDGVIPENGASRIRAQDKQITAVLFERLRNATTSIHIDHVFLLDRAVVEELKEASNRGVQVTVVRSSPETSSFEEAGRTFYDEINRYNKELPETMKDLKEHNKPSLRRRIGKLLGRRQEEGGPKQINILKSNEVSHAKVIVIDAEVPGQSVAIMGSANLTKESKNAHGEVALEFRNHEMVTHLSRAVRDMEGNAETFMRKERTMSQKRREQSSQWLREAVSNIPVVGSWLERLLGGKKG